MPVASCGARRRQRWTNGGPLAPGDGRAAQSDPHGQRALADGARLLWALGQIVTLPGDLERHYLPGPLSMLLFGNGAFADGVRLRGGPSRSILLYPHPGTLVSS